MTLMLDHATQQGGFEKPQDGLGTETCPKCGSGTLNGFGLMGGSMGAYVMCDGERDDASVGMECGWYYKESKNEPPPGQSTI